MAFRAAEAEEAQRRGGIRQHSAEHKEPPAFRLAHAKLKEIIFFLFENVECLSEKRDGLCCREKKEEGKRRGSLLLYYTDFESEETI